jgi:hypothetical protein
MKKLISEKRKFITLGISNSSGKTRLVPIAFTILDEWKIKKKGILGC